MPGRSDVERAAPRKNLLELCRVLESYTVVGIRYGLQLYKDAVADLEALRRKDHRIHAQVVVLLSFPKIQLTFIAILIKVFIILNVTF